LLEYAGALTTEPPPQAITQPEPEKYGDVRFNERFDLKASSEINFGFIRDLGLYAFCFVVETAAIYS
jgi:hypothetical protein